MLSLSFTDVQYDGYVYLLSLFESFLILLFNTMIVLDVFLVVGYFVTNSMSVKASGPVDPPST